MNKFLAFAVLAFVAVAANATDEFDDEMSQVAILTSDFDEVHNVPFELKEAFEDYCISSRDWVLADIKSSTNSVASRAFKIFFNSVEALGEESMENQKNAQEKLSNQLANPSAPVAEGDSRVDQIIADGQAKMQGQNVASALITAFKTAFSASSSGVGAFINQKLDGLKQLASVDQIGASLNEVCEKVRAYEVELKQQLEQYKSNSLNNEQKFADVTMDQLKCTTARRVSQIEGLCRFANTLKPFVGKMMATTRA